MSLLEREWFRLLNSENGGNELVKDNFDNVRIVATGGNIDLALLKIEGQSKNKTFPCVPLGNSSELRQGNAFLQSEAR